MINSFYTIVKIDESFKKVFEQYGVRLPRTEYVCDNILSLPCYFTLPKHHQDYIINAIKEFYEH